MRQKKKKKEQNELKTETDQPFNTWPIISCMFLFGITLLCHTTRTFAISAFAFDFGSLFSLSLVLNHQITNETNKNNRRQISLLACTK